MEVPKLQPTVQTIFTGESCGCNKFYTKTLRHIVRRPEYTQAEVEEALREVPPNSIQHLFNHETPHIILGMARTIYLGRSINHQLQGFLECDRVMRNEESLKDEMAGSTAVVVLTQGNKLWSGCHL